jgi:hypothetical protein
MRTALGILIPMIVPLYTIEKLKKVWWHDATLFIYFLYNLEHTFIQSHSHSVLIRRHIHRGFSPSLNRQIAQLEKLPEVTSRDLNPDLTNCEPTRYLYQMRYAAPQNFSCVQHIEISKPKKSKRTFLRRIHIDLMRKAEWREEYGTVFVQWLYVCVSMCMCSACLILI